MRGRDGRSLPCQWQPASYLPEFIEKRWINRGQADGTEVALKAGSRANQAQNPQDKPYRFLFLYPGRTLKCPPAACTPPPSSLSSSRSSSVEGSCGVDAGGD